jgi:hypothetical protein
VILWFMTYRINSFADLFFFSRFEDIWFRERKNMEHIGFKIIKSYGSTGLLLITFGNFCCQHIFMNT